MNETKITFYSCSLITPKAPPQYSVIVSRKLQNKKPANIDHHACASEIMALFLQIQGFIFTCKTKFMIIRKTRQNNN